LERGAKETVAWTDGLLEIANEVSPGHALKYNKHYIGLTRDGVPDNFVTFRARTDYLIVEFRIPHTEEISALILTELRAAIAEVEELQAQFDSSIGQ
jgi:hypothetical protein